MVVNSSFYEIRKDELRKLWSKIEPKLSECLSYNVESDECSADVYMKIMQQQNVRIFMIKDEKDKDVGFFITETKDDICNIPFASSLDSLSLQDLSFHCESVAKRFGCHSVEISSSRKSLIKSLEKIGYKQTYVTVRLKV